MYRIFTPLLTLMFFQRTLENHEKFSLFFGFLVSLAVRFATAAQLHPYLKLSFVHLKIHKLFCEIMKVGQFGQVSLTSNYCRDKYYILCKCECSFIPDYTCAGPELHKSNRIIESEKGFDWQGLLETIQFTPPPALSWAGTSSTRSGRSKTHPT